jgi:hypothetical protein
MLFVSVFAIMVGILMIAQWVFSLVAHKVPELKTEPVEIRFHIVSEVATSLALIISGAGLLSEASWSGYLYPVAIGALLYTMVKSSGYFAERKVWALVAVFAVLFILALVSLGIFFNLP